MLLTPAQIKPKLFQSRQNCCCFLPGVDAPHVYVRAWAQGCFYSLISTRTFRWAPDRVGGQLRGDKECPFIGVTRSGRVERRTRDGKVAGLSPGRNGGIIFFSGVNFPC